MTKLYSIDKKGKIRVFGCWTTSQNSYTTASGLLDGALTQKETKIISGKQRRTIQEQVQFDMSSIINEKADEGYKSLASLMARYKELKYAPLPEGVEMQDEAQLVQLLFTLMHLKYNTNTYWLPLPMLAEKWKDHKKKVTYPAFLQPKLNGVRCIAVWDKDEKKVKLLSRGGQVFIMPELELALTPFFQDHPFVQLDGELYKHSMPLQEIVGRVKVEDKAQFGRKHVIEYHIYDIAMEDFQQFVRIDMVARYVDEIKHFNVVAVPTIQIVDEAQAKEFHDAFVQSGYEGAIIRDANAYYQFGFRDKVLLKYKEFIDEEFEIVGCDVDESKGIESFVFILENNNGKKLTSGYANQFRARPTGTLEDKEIWRQNIHKYIGKKATVRYQERTVEELPHQAHVRADKTTYLMEAIRDYE